MDLNKEIINAVKSNKAIIGTKESINLMKNKKCKLVIFAQNTPINVKEELESISKITNIPIKMFKGNNKELGILCKKPFNISVIAIKG